MRGAIYLSMILGMLTMMACAFSSKKRSTPTAILKQHQFSQLDSLLSKEQRPIAVFIHTDWCKYCHTMSQTTFKNESVINLLNQHYYFIDFDAEQKEAIYFRNRLFEYQPNGRTTGTHQLANALGAIDGVLTYPTFVLLNSEYEIIFQHNSLLTAAALLKILKEGLS